MKRHEVVALPRHWMSSTMSCGVPFGCAASAALASAGSSARAIRIRSSRGGRRRLRLSVSTPMHVVDEAEPHGVALAMRGHDIQCGIAIEIAPLPKNLVKPSESQHEPIWNHLIVEGGAEVHL